MGAGLAGVTTAWYLARDGHEVVVIDREPEVAAAASDANTGIIAASRAYPWSAGEIGRALRRSALRLDPELSALGHAAPPLRSGGSYRRVLEAKVRLVRYSQQDAARAGRRDRLQRDSGAACSTSTATPRRSTRRGSARRRCASTVSPSSVSSRAQVAQHEPAIDASRLAGALYAPATSWPTRRSSAASSPRAAARSASASTWRTRSCRSSRLDARIREVVTRAGRVRGDAFVCALGVMDRRLREQLGTHVPVYPVTGYSATVPSARNAAPRLAMIDESRGVAFAPLGERAARHRRRRVRRLRHEHEPHDFAPLYDTVKQLFPGAVDYARARVRACQRPMTPETTPRFGTGRYQNLWFNIGLGHMGFAMAAGAGRITADLVCGHGPPIDLEGLRIRRH